MRVDFDPVKDAAKQALNDLGQYYTSVNSWVIISMCWLYTRPLIIYKYCISDL